MASIAWGSVRRQLLPWPPSKAVKASRIRQAKFAQRLLLADHGL